MTAPRNTPTTPVSTAETAGPTEPGRRRFLREATGLLAAAAVAPIAAAQEATQSPNSQNYVTLPPIHDVQTEGAEKTPGPFEPAEERVGFAVVGLGRLSLDQILPAFARTRLCKPVALVSGDAEKARKIAQQYGIRQSSLYSYATFDQIARNPEVRVIYIVLPNSMHLEYTVRGARAGKHIFSEKPMAVSVAECEKMISACREARVLLGVAYRQQYEPMNRAIVKMVKAGKLGPLRSFIATNTQNEGDPTQWRLKRALAGGGCLPDVGIYCLNAARFLSGEEPSEVFGYTWRPNGDPRFREVEATCNFALRFPSGFLATCSTGYAGHKSQSMRLEGADAWAEMSPAFAYHGLKLKVSHLMDGRETAMEPSYEDKDQFALEMDHMAECVLNNRQPHTPGEEGLQDQRVMEAIYESARTGRSVKVSPPPAPTRGPEPAESA